MQSGETISISRQLTEAMQFQQAGRFDESERLCAGVLAREPGHLDALQMLVAGRFMRGQHAEAIAALEPALRLHPDNFELIVLAGHCSRALGRLDQTAVHYARAAVLRPDSAECRVMLGWTLKALDRRPEAIAQCLEAVKLNPDLVEAHNNLGVMLHDNGELEPAVACYHEVLKRQPAHVQARRNLAAALRAERRIEAALSEFEALLALDPGHAYAELMVMHTRRELCRWRDYGAMAARARELAVTGRGAFSPFLLFAWPVAPELLLAAARAYAASALPPESVEPVAIPAAVMPARTKLRIGYYSADFRDHVVAAVMPEVLELHDRKAFDVIGYSYGPDDAGPRRWRIQKACSAFFDIRGMSDDSAVRKIRADGIDILVDLTGFTGNIRHGIPARRAAPIQINWLGYPGSSGSPAVDYLVADPFTVPVEAEQFYSEKIIRLPGSCQPHDGTQPVGAERSRADYGLPEAGFVFCSFNHVQKITPDVFQVWMAILQAVPGSVLWLRADRDEAVANLRAEAGAVGVTEGRLIFAPRAADMADHLARYRVAQLALDTFPYSSHTTANDALWLGCPLLTMAGDTFAARVAGSILHALDLPELVTGSLAAYRDAAVRLAMQIADHSALRAKLAAARDTGSHFDTKRYTRDLEAGYRQAWNIHAAGQKPRHVAVAVP